MTTKDDEQALRLWDEAQKMPGMWAINFANLLRAEWMAQGKKMVTDTEYEHMKQRAAELQAQLERVEAELDDLKRSILDGSHPNLVLERRERQSAEYAARVATESLKITQRQVQEVATFHAMHGDVLTEIDVPIEPNAAQVPEGCTPADAAMLRQANHDLAIESWRRGELLREWLETELDAQDEEYQPWLDSFTERVKAALPLEPAAGGQETAAGQENADGKAEGDGNSVPAPSAAPMRDPCWFDNMKCEEGNKK